MEGGKEGGREGGRPYTCSEIQYIIDNSHMGTSPEQNDRHLLKHYLPSTWCAGGKYKMCLLTLVWIVNVVSHSTFKPVDNTTPVIDIKCGRVGVVGCFKQYTTACVNSTFNHKQS